jgi:hypothetical protein
MVNAETLARDDQQLRGCDLIGRLLCLGEGGVSAIGFADVEPARP